MSTELLPKVEVWRLPEHVTRALKDAMRIVLDERDHRASALVGGMRAKEAATYLGIGRSKFYQLLKHDVDLMGSSFGVGTARMWPRKISTRGCTLRSSEQADLASLPQR